MMEQPYIPSISERSYDNPNTQEHLDKQIVQAIDELQELSSSMGREYAKDVVLNKEGSDIEIIPEQPHQGDTDSVSYTRKQNWGRYPTNPIKYLGSIHAHPDDSPPSYEDILQLTGSSDIYTIVSTVEGCYFFLKSKEYIPTDNSSWEVEYKEFVENILNANSQEDIDEKIWEQTKKFCSEKKILIYKQKEKGKNTFELVQESDKLLNMIGNIPINN